jgi:hypothetical protein
MGIFQPFTKEHTYTTMRTSLGTMHGLETNKAAVRSETKVSIRPSQMRQSVERDAIHAHEDGRGEMRFRVELHPVNIVVV